MTNTLLASASNWKIINSNPPPPGRAVMNGMGNNQVVLCSCGGGNGADHPVGVGGCLRYHVTEENELPKNRRRWYNPEWWEEPVWIWDIGDHWVTEYTLFSQRLYSRDQYGNWTRPKTKP